MAAVFPIANRDAPLHAAWRLARRIPAAGDQATIVFEAILVSRHSGTPLA